MTTKTALRQKTASAASHGFKDLSGVDGAPEGTYEAYVSVFGNVDLVGDRVKAGAFAKDLEAWAASGDPVPVIWSHQWQDPDFHIGKTLEIEEVQAGDERLPAAIKDLGGLRTKSLLDVETNPVAARVWLLLKERRIREFSFAYDVLDEAKAKDGANDLLDLRLIEQGPTLKGANPATQLVDVKAAPEAKAEALAKAGARNSASDATRLQSIHDLVKELGAACETADADPEGASASSGDAAKAVRAYGARKALDQIALLELDLLSV